MLRAGKRFPPGVDEEETSKGVASRKEKNDHKERSMRPVYPVERGEEYRSQLTSGSLSPISFPCVLDCLLCRLSS